MAFGYDTKRMCIYLYVALSSYVEFQVHMYTKITKYKEVAGCLLDSGSWPAPTPHFPHREPSTVPARYQYKLFDRTTAWFLKACRLGIQIQHRHKQNNVVTLVHFSDLWKMSILLMWSIYLSTSMTNPIHIHCISRSLYLSYA